MAIREVDLGKVRGDINDSQAIFTQASTRSNIASGETGSTIFGKIKKWFADLGAAAFCSVVNNATTTAANTVLDGRMGKTLQNGIDSLNSNYNDLNQYSERDLVEYKLTRLGNVKQFIYNTRIPKEWKANTRFAMNTAAFAVEYRPKATFGTAAVITGTGVVALMDFDADGFIYIKPITTIAVGTWVTIHVCYI